MQQAGEEQAGTRVASSADDKRWAIVPPPSPESSAISGEFHVDPRLGQVAGLADPTANRASSAKPNGGKVNKERTTSAPVPRKPPSQRARDAVLEDLPPAKRGRHVNESSILAVEPADSQLDTERPLAEEPSGVTRAEGQETIPAPSWVDDLEG